MTADDQAATTEPAARIEPLTRLATGGMAEIWLARELGAAGLERFVVTKRLLPHLARDRDVVEMFVSEARFVARLVHPNVVQIHELAKDENGYFLVMEYVAGCSVRELMLATDKAEQALPPEVAICIVEQACRGAHAAHELTDSSGQSLGLVHRDISPHNLMIGPGGDVKLLDFGIAKATAAADATRTGSLKGKSGYMAPEQCRGERVDRRSDVFALGIVLWELLVGKRLFKREADFASMEAIVAGDYRLPSEVRPDLPTALDSVVAKALTTQVDARWQTAEELRQGILAAAAASDLRPTRDGLGATLTELLGERLEQRKQALRSAAKDKAGPSPSALRAALVHSEPSMERSSTDTTGHSQTGSDDVATVIQRRALSSDKPPAGPHGPAATAPVDPATPSEDETLVHAGHPDHRRRPRERRRESKPRRWHPVAWLLIGVAVLSAAALAILFVTDRLPKERVTQNVQDGPSAQDALNTQDAAAPPTGEPLNFVIAPTVEPQVIRRELAPFTRWLGGELNRPIELIVADSYQHSSDLVTSGGADLGLLPPLMFVQTFAREPRLRPLVLRLFDGSRASDGYLLVRDDTPAKGAADLRDKAICLVDRDSTTGFLLPRLWLRAADLDPDKDVRIILSGDHLSALRDLLAGRCDAAAVYSGAYLSAQKRGINVGTIRVLAITGHVPQDVLAATPSMPEAEAERLKAALLRFKPQLHIDAPRLGAVLGISGFAEFDAADFDVIRQAAEREGFIPTATKR